MKLNRSADFDKYERTYYRRRTTPFSERIAELKHAALTAVSPDDMTAVMQAVVKEAKEGNVFAASLLFDRIFGKAIPAQAEDAGSTKDMLREIWERIKDDGTSEPDWRPKPEEQRVLPSQSPVVS